MLRRSALALLFLFLLPAQTSAMVLPNALPKTSGRTEALLQIRQRPELPKPGEDVNRGMFVASLVRRLNPGAVDGCFERLSSAPYHLLFKDVRTDHPLAPELCAAMEAGIIRGYPDGTFRPDRVINHAEAAKVIAKAYGIADEPLDPDVPWYAPSVAALMRLGIVPDGPLDRDYTPTQARRAIQVVRCSDEVFLRRRPAAPSPSAS
ncbi:MAG: S-layer homology domain-containing protein [Candidatus Peribacteraceae bacterium]|nr:S-layer homology domain-containing protein [Candidatus Peribacteraceae bacterium]